MKEYAVIISALVLVLAGGLWAVNTRQPAPSGVQICPLDTRLCPNGSSVGRGGPRCEFAQCPTAATTTAGGGSILPYNSGVRGTVLLGPTCPVERIPPDPACADKPYATAVAVYRAGAVGVFATGNSDASGAFTFSLPPGNYTLTATGGAMLPRCAPAQVTVGPTGYATTSISCDTGIR